LPFPGDKLSAARPLICLYFCVLNAFNIFLGYLVINPNPRGFNKENSRDNLKPLQNFMQPLPNPVPNNLPHIANLVAADILYRKQIGIRKYGTPLQPFNNRSALQDAYEEVLDLANYLKQKLEEERINLDNTDYPDW
jgi:hypothetical protein